MTTTNLIRVLSKDESIAFKAAWRLRVSNNHVPAGDFLLHALLLGKDPLRAFVPVSNANKLANGQTPFQALKRLSYCVSRTAPAELDRWMPNLTVDRRESVLAALAGSFNTLADRLVSAEGM